MGKIVNECRSLIWLGLLSHTALSGDTMEKRAIPGASHLGAFIQNELLTGGKKQKEEVHPTPLLL